MKRTVLFYSLLFVISHIGFSQGKLEKAEKSISKKQSTIHSSGNSSGETQSNNYNDNESNIVRDTEFFGFGDLLVEIGAIITYGIIFETSIESDHKGSKASITKYPYHSAKKGNYAYEWGEDTEVFRTTFTNRFIAENSDLYGNHLNVQMRFLNRIGLEGNYLQIWENNTFSGNNALAMYTLLAKYHRIRTEKFDAYWGMGASYVDGEVNQWGFTYGIGAELFFAKPLSLEANFNQTLINESSINKFDAFLNYHINRYKISGGYENLNIGNVNFSTFSAGLGFSF